MQIVGVLEKLLARAPILEVPSYFQRFRANYATQTLGQEFGPYHSHYRAK
jgi:hypothetical protein